MSRWASITAYLCISFDSRANFCLHLLLLLLLPALCGVRGVYLRTIITLSIHLSILFCNLNDNCGVLWSQASDWRGVSVRPLNPPSPTSNLSLTTKRQHRQECVCMAKREKAKTLGRFEVDIIHRSWSMKVKKEYFQLERKGCYRDAVHPSNQ